jgi:ligand-binding sensor domain-containing protein
MGLKRPFLKLLILVLCSFSAVYASTPYQIVYLKNYSTPDGLPSSRVNYLMQDSKGFIWIATDKGVSRFDGQHFKNFTSAPYIFLLQQLPLLLLRERAYP